MSLQKKLVGQFEFVARADTDEGDSKAQFDLIFELLSHSYRAAMPIVATDKGEAQVALPDNEKLPFAVVLSFEERSGSNLIGTIETKLKALFRKLVDAAANLPGPVGLAAKTIDALDDLLTKDPSAPEATDVKSLELDKRSDLEWGRISKLMQTWNRGMFPKLDLGNLTQKDWQDFLTKLREKAADPAAPAQPDAGAAAPAAPPAPTAPFLFTQLMGWLTSRTDEDGAIAYGFDIEGACRFPDNAAEYGTWARLDVFGPDGSQLLTRRVDFRTLAGWLYGSGSEDLKVEIAPTHELRAALARPNSQKRDISTVSGRLWFSDGQPFGTRTVAIYVKPALAHLIDDCCPPDEFEFKGCCGEIDESVPILDVPQALAVTQTDQAGYFEFSYASDQPLASRYALIQVSGLSIPLALELRIDDHSAEPVISFPKPILLQIESALILPERDTRKIQWIEEEEEADCGCRGLDFGGTDRALDEFKTDIVVRTTDPMIVRRRLGLDGQEDDTLPASDNRTIRPTDSALERNFRAPITRDAQVEWDGDPLVAQAVTISHGRILTISQIWRADGYSLGDLRYSLPLAPLQKKNIAIIDWDRSDRLSMESTQTYQESLNNFVGRERDVSEIVNSALSESTSGRSESGGSSRSAGGGFSLGPIAFGGGSGGSSSAWSSSSQNSTRTLAANFINKLRDQTVQAANALRAQRVTVVQQVSQSESARAVTETVANRNACHAITVQYFEVLRHFRVDHELSAVRECLYIPLPITAFDAPKVLRWRQAIETYLPSSYRAGLEALAGDGAAGSAIYADEALTGITIALDMDLDFPLPPTKIEDTTKWSDYFALGVTPASPLPALFNELRQLADSERAKFFEAKIAPVLAHKFVASLNVVGLTTNGEIDLDMAPSLVSSYRAGATHKVTFAERGSVAPRAITRRSLSAVRIKTPVAIPEFDTVTVGASVVSLSTEHLSSHVSASAGDKGGLETSQMVEFVLPLRPDELADRKVVGDSAKARLLSHLNENVEFYHKAIWWTMDPDRRFALLDGFIAPNAGGRSVASVVENRLVAIVGNCIVMPVAPGIRLDYFDESAADAGGAPHDKDEDWLLARYRPLIPNPATHIAVPTRGVFAESVMGSCNGCEKIDNSRNWQYWQHPLPDEPTAIESVSLESRAKDTPVVQPASMPGATVINQVASSIPQAPDPIGLASAIAAITNGAAFRDVTGLAGTQQNARDALTQSYAATTKFGELGAELSKKQIDAAIDAMKMVVTAYTGMPISGKSDSGNDGESVGKSIAQAAQKGHITTHQAQGLTADLHRKMIERLGTSDGASLPNVPEVRDAIARGGEEGAPISVSRGDTRVDIGAPTRPAARSNSNQSIWPFTSRGSAARADSKVKKQLPMLKIEIVTAIRDVGDAMQVGEKSRQTVLLDCDKRVLTQFPVALGDTKIWRISLKPVRSKFTAELYDSANDIFSMFILGQTASGVRFMPDIDYRLRITVDPLKRRIRLSGAHDGFPSYSILLNDKRIYDFEQNLFVESATALMGTSDVTVDREVSY